MLVIITLSDVALPLLEIACDEDIVMIELLENVVGFDALYVRKSVVLKNLKKKGEGKGTGNDYINIDSIAYVLAPYAIGWN